MVMNKYQISKYAYPIKKVNLVVGFDCGWRSVYFEDNIEEINSALKALEKGSINLPKRYNEILEYLYELGILEASSQFSMPWWLYSSNQISISRAVRQSMVIESWTSDPTQYTTSRLMNLFLESYFIINSAAHHISEALYNDLSEEDLKVIDSYLSEEEWHGKFLFYGFRKAGLSAENIHGRIYLEESHELINYLADLAKNDLLAYLVCLSVSESPTACPGNITKRLEAWDLLESKNLVHPAIIKAFRTHEEMDFLYDHGNLAHEFSFKQLMISPEKQDDISKKVLAFIKLQSKVYEKISEAF
jgi:hypothetical protein